MGEAGRAAARASHRDERLERVAAWSVVRLRVRLRVRVRVRVRVGEGEGG